jgi:hypothetical protein
VPPNCGSVMAPSMPEPADGQKCWPVARNCYLRSRKMRTSLGARSRAQPDSLGLANSQDGGSEKLSGGDAVLRSPGRPTRWNLSSARDAPLIPAQPHRTSP